MEGLIQSFAINFLKAVSEDHAFFGKVRQSTIDKVEDFLDKIDRINKKRETEAD